MFKHVKLVIFSLLLALPLSALAFAGQSGEVVTLAKDKVINTNYYAAGNSIEIYGTVNGDIFVAGDTITIDSENINGDIFVAGNNISIKGKINGSIRAVGQRVDVSGEVSGNAMALGQNFRVDSNGKVLGHVTFFGQMVSIVGEIGRLEGAMEKASISGKVINDVDVYLSGTPANNPLQLSEGANVGGNLYYQSLSKLNINKDFVVGDISFNKIVKEKDRFLDKAGIFGMIVKFFGMIVVGMIGIYLWPRVFSDAYNRTKKHSVRTLLKGILLLVVTPLACLLIAITVIGLPLAMIIMGAWLIGLYLAQVMGAWLLGNTVKERLLKKYKWSPLGLISFGALLYILIGKIPLVGFFFIMIVYIIAWGNFAYLFKINKEHK
ncbi:hypothetical protein KKH39_00490 [Patescibacteria group bacterium]|nr:hypothetical protein [Patescibacteria group bacterium]